MTLNTKIHESEMDSDIEKNKNREVIITSIVFFIIVLFVVKYLFEMPIRIFELFHILGVSVFYFVAVKTRHLSEYFKKTREIYEIKLVKSNVKTAESFSLPSWTTYKLLSYKRKVGQIGLVLLITSIFLRTPLGIPNLPVLGLYTFGCLVVFGVFMSFRDFIKDHFEFISNYQTETYPTLQSLDDSYLKKYWIVFIVVVILITSGQYLIASMINTGLVLYKSIGFSLFVATISSITMSYVYARKTYSLLLLDLDLVIKLNNSNQ